MGPQRPPTLQTCALNALWPYMGPSRCCIVQYTVCSTVYYTHKPAHQAGDLASVLAAVCFLPRAGVSCVLEAGHCAPQSQPEGHRQSTCGSSGGCTPPHTMQPQLAQLPCAPVWIADVHTCHHRGRGCDTWRLVLQARATGCCCCSGSLRTHMPEAHTHAYTSSQFSSVLVRSITAQLGCMGTCASTPSS